MNVIDSNSLERHAGGKSAYTFPHPAWATRPAKQNQRRRGLFAALLLAAAFFAVLAAPFAAAFFAGTGFDFATMSGDFAAARF